MFGLIGSIAIGGLVSLWLAEAQPIGREVVSPLLAIGGTTNSGNYEERVGAADIAVIFYTDYQCPLCRSAAPVLRSFVQRDGNIRVIYKEWPILGSQSERAAEVALAAKRQDIYKEVHERLMKTPLPLSEGKLRKAVEDSGGDWTQILRDLEEHSGEIQGLLSANGQEAVSLGLRGTPSYLIGSIVIEGSASYSELTKAIYQARKSSARSLTHKNG